MGYKSLKEKLREVFIMGLKIYLGGDCCEAKSEGIRLMHEKPNLNTLLTVKKEC